MCPGHCSASQADNAQKGDAFMNVKTVLAIGALCLITALALAFLDTPVYAAAGDGELSGDKDLATKKGLDALETKEFDKNKLPGKLEIGLAVGSIFAMVAVVKWA